MQTPTIDVTVRPSVLARGGLTTADIARAFAAQNKVVDAGAVETAENRLRIESTGNFYSLDDIRRMTITSQTGEHFRLADIARVEEGYKRPAGNIMRIDGKPALGVAVATVSTGNVVDMARAVAECIDRFERTLPEGFDLHPIYDQGYESEVANRGFVWNLIISVLTVVGILLFFIGFKNGILIGSGLVFSIFATLIVMYVQGIALQRMSLAAIIIAMGMLVDNAIVVSDSALVNMQRGMRKRVAILRACSSTALPLLAATAIAILTFMPIYYSPHITGELLSSLVIVIGISLMFSWVFAMTQTPFFIQQFVRRPRPDELKGVPFSGRGYDRFRSWLRFVIRHKFATLVLLVGLLGVAREFRNAVADLARIVGERVEEGEYDRQELLTVEVKLNEAEYQLLRAQSEFEIGRMALNSLIGVPLEAETPVGAVVAEVGDVNDSVCDLSLRPEVRIAREKIRMEWSSLRANDARYKPQLYVGADAGYLSPGYDFRPDLSPNYAVYAQLSVPIYEGGRRRSEKRAGEKRAGMAADELHRVESEVELQTRTAWTALGRAEQRVELSRSSLEKARENERRATEEYEEGAISLADVIDAQVYRQTAQTNDVTARAEAQLHLAELLKALHGYGAL